MGGRSGQSTGGGSGGSGAAITSLSDYKDVRIYENGNNNTNLSAKDYIAIAGIPKSFKGDVEIQYQSYGVVNVNIRDRDIVMQREINITNKTIYNAYFSIPKDSKLKGQGAKIFSNQVKAAQKAGFDKINVSAAGSKNDRTYNGYYTWARLGYRPNNSMQEVASIFRDTGRNYGTWENMMKSKQGVADWKEHGSSWRGSFDLKKGSYSDKALKEYLKSKKK
jgi:hypothetical protein